MGHTDVVTVDPTKWKHGPFSATREGGYVYGRGTLDDKPDVVAGLMTIIQLKRMKVALDRDVIFFAVRPSAAPSRLDTEAFQSSKRLIVESTIPPRYPR